MSNERFDRIEEKIDKISDKLSSIDVTLAVNTESLKEHMARTELLEKALTPVQKGYTMVVGIIKFFGFIAVLAAIAEGVSAVLTYIKVAK